MKTDVVDVKQKMQVDQTLAAFLLLVVLGAISMLAGVYTLAGPGWMLIAASIEMFAAAAFLKLAMTNAGPNETA
jgi:ABC-type transport system involved in cytochrome bd biosynthesis fused ATPase/permease subunit